VRIRRTIGLKKDQFLINDQPYSNVDFQNLLESAGLSRSNPYYIVEQGKIAMLMKQAKSERLELLKEIAGTRTYDDRKKESLKIMKETDAKLKQIDAVVEVLEQRLKELEEESAEFKKYLVRTTQTARSWQSMSQSHAVGCV
jgi:structural maintenance of chromosome 3 (chondroitin sulfate proteoglycan 6)